MQPAQIALAAFLFFFIGTHLWVAHKHLVDEVVSWWKGLFLLTLTSAPIYFVLFLCIYTMPFEVGASAVQP